MGRAVTTLRAMPQAEVVAALAEFARRWRDPADPFRRQAEAVTEPFPFVMVRLSLDALLDSLTPDALWGLIDDEGVRDAYGVPVVGHVIAGNTPLLAWTSLLRALLMRSASVVKLPSGAAAGWGRLFQESLQAVSPTLASGITLGQWPGGTGDRDRALCESADLILAYGSDSTIAALRALCPARTPLVGYGHRVSFGVIGAGADGDAAARGLATDILLYDQGGCLSPQTVFVEGGWEAARDFAGRLAAALVAAVAQYPLPWRAPQAAMRVREARMLARMERETRIWEDADLRWTVIARPGAVFTPSPTHGVVSVQPLGSFDALPAALAPVRGRLQGCALAAPSEPSPVLGLCSQSLDPSPQGGRSGVNSGVKRGQGGGGQGEGMNAVPYVCPPGRLQAPPLSWPQDGIAVLRTLYGAAGVTASAVGLK